MNYSASVYHKRRQDLVALIKKDLPTAQGPVLLIGNFEHERVRFRQESSFYYFTGVEEPGALLLMELDGSTTLYVPAFAGNRSQWMQGALAADAATAEKLLLSAVVYAGKPFKGYQASPLFSSAEYETVCKRLAQVQQILTITPTDMHRYIDQQQAVNRMRQCEPKITASMVDISHIIARMRRKKSRLEIELMFKAAELTMVAQEAAARSIGDGVRESQVQAGIEYVFCEAGATAAFPSIVATGKNSTVLHYNRNNHTMRDGDLVVVDIGAEYEYYCSDLTRTYPVSGTFSRRQREIYSAVLETQEFVASRAKPGMWLSNKDRPEESLHHLAVSFLEKKGFSKYFLHGIGHFLGMDVHDVGNSAEPLQEGDVITIEPGIYIPEERIGVRIEDDYWLVKDGVECLSAELPKSVKDIEELAQSSMEDEFEVDEEDYEDMQ
jgi:Xaa-Pro aminopeptidase